MRYCENCPGNLVFWSVGAIGAGPNESQNSEDRKLRTNQNSISAKQNRKNSKKCKTQEKIERERGDGGDDARWWTRRHNGVPFVWNGTEAHGGGGGSNLEREREAVDATMVRLRLMVVACYASSIFTH